jgi:uncharacterized protein YjbI with pentapeptide repeats
MANAEHVEILQSGMRTWTQWRAAFPDITPDLTGADFSRADFEGVDFEKTNLCQANLSEANLGHANLNEANLMEAFLHRTNLMGACLTRADFRRARLSIADLTLADLRAADFSEANLSSADLGYAILTGANLVKAHMARANLSKAMFLFANLSFANLCHANLSAARLKGADFNGAHFGQTALINVDLSEAVGLESAVHEYPSSLGIDTLYQSKGKIPESFLRGVGIPDDFIKALPDFLDPGIEFYSCFISFSMADEAFCQRSIPACKRNTCGSGLRLKISRVERLSWINSKPRLGSSTSCCLFSPRIASIATG